jgi:hypothetical protein
MNTTCNKEWTRQFISSVFTTVFINGKLKKHREQLLFDNERDLLPATQPEVERRINVENADNELRKIKQKIIEFSIEKRRLQSELWRLNNRQITERAEFVRACPDEGCRGFLSTQWKCGICQKWACPDCHVVKGLDRDVEHECNPETLATARLLANDTKPCPKCQIGIFKIDGCDQIWCTQCHTAFNWRTGRIESNVHNPHYFEWLRRNGNAVPRNPLDVPCQTELTHRTYTDIHNILLDRHEGNAFTKWCDIYLSRTIRNTIHMRYSILGRYGVADRVRRNENLRILYMRNRITEEEFKITLQRNEKKASKCREISDVLTILLTTITDIVLRFANHVRTCERNQWEMTILEEIDPIVDYVNECLRHISKAYSSSLIQFSNEILEK